MVVVGGGGRRDPGPVKGPWSRSRSQTPFMVWGSGARGARVCAGSGLVPKGALRPGRPGAWTPGTARTPRHTSTHTPQDGHPETRAHGSRRPEALRQTDTAAHGHSGARLPAATRPQRGHAPAQAPARPQGGQPRRALLPSCR